MGDELDDEERSDLEVEISEALKASRHGVKLSNKLVDNMVVFFIESVKVDSIEDVPMDEPDELEECAREAWQDGYSKPLPGVLALKVRKCVLRQSGRSQVRGTAKCNMWNNLPGGMLGSMGRRNRMRSAQR